jgi:hypothetical protein
MAEAGQPANSAIRQKNAILDFKLSFSGNGSLHGGMSPRAIIRMNPLLKIVVGDCLAREELKKLADLIGKPELFCFAIQFPNSQPGRFSREGGAFLDFMHGFLLLELIGDIDARANVAEEFPDSVIARMAFIGDCAIDTVVTSEPILEGERLSELK